MPGYLDHYGEDDVRRERRRKLIVNTAVTVAIVTFVLALFFHNRRERKIAEEFGSLVTAKKFDAAYALFGCSTPCKDYPLDKFLEDFGPKSKYGVIKGFEVLRSSACGSGVMITARIEPAEAPAQTELFWVEKETGVMGFAPWSVCPKREFSEIVLDRFKDWFGIGSRS